ncbi:MAG: flavohemoglobin expression-modulating QEGLA motif protein [Oligoflexia bacterium]|nr:flavohemoglobin expression-modulating QEGLA motif protein [Oligoflexia bacterium]
MWTTYKEKLKDFSERLIDAQKQIRIIDALKWDPKIIEAVQKSKFKELPKVDVSTYQSLPVEYDFKKKDEELSALIEDIQNDLGTQDALAKILLTTCREYQTVLKMLQNRGKKEFYEYSRQLYGSPQDNFFGSLSTVKDLGIHLYNIFCNVQTQSESEKDKVDIPANIAVKELEKRFEKNFPNQGVKVVLEDEMVADASASAKTIKLRQSANFSNRDIDILEVHEGWVHMGTTINGIEQKIAKWLHKGSPRVTATQEGLAVLMEIFSFVTFPRRARKINDRVLAIAKAEDGADFLEVVEYFRTEGYEEYDCLIAAQRVFRGGDVRGKFPFTKDITYCKGFVENYNFIRACIQSGKSEMVPFLFAGKVHLSDVPILYQKYQEGIIDAPKFVPPFFKNLDSLIVWMSFSNFLSAAGMTSAQDAYKSLLLKG